MIFTKHSAQPRHAINLAVNLFHEMRYYKVISSVCGEDSSVGTHIYGKKRSSADYRWTPPPDGWVKINANA